MPEFITLADGSLAVKGRNLLKGFTVHVPALWSNNTAGYPVTNDNTESDGYPAYRVRRTNPTLNPSVMSLYNGIYGDHLTRYNLKGETITASCYVRASMPTTTTMMAMAQEGSQSVNAIGGSFAIGTEWVQISRTLTLDFDLTDKSVIRVSPMQMTIPESQRDGSFWVEYSRIKLEFGTEATPFSYAPEDEEAV